MVDERGNVLLAWETEDSVIWRRWDTSTKLWGAAQEFKNQVPATLGMPIVVDEAGNIVLIWSNALGVWASRFE